MNLGNSLNQALIKLTRLILKADVEGEEREELLEQHEALTEQLQELVNNTIPKDMDEYAKANGALLQAIAKIDEAQQDVNKIADVIGKVSTAVKLVGQLVDKVA